MTDQKTKLESLHELDSAVAKVQNLISSETKQVDLAMLEYALVEITKKGRALYAAAERAERTRA